MSAPLLTTKLYIPTTRSDAVPRPRLNALLDRGLASKLTLIAAPAGFGKTTLIAAWLHSVERRAQSVEQDSAVTSTHAPGQSLYALRSNALRSAWLSLDDDDNDPVRLLTYLIAAVRTIDPAIGQAALAFLGAPQLPSYTTLLTLLINDLASLPERIILVLDDYHVVTNAEVHTAITFLVDHLPPQLHLVITTRDEPALPLARMRVRGQVNELHLHDLRFTIEEAAAFLTHTMGLVMTPEEVQTLERRTEGWIAGLQMAALSLQGSTRAHGASTLNRAVNAFSGGHRYVIDYLAEEVLRQQPHEIRAFLSQTAILDRLCAPLCDAVINFGFPISDFGLEEPAIQNRVPRRGESKIQNSQQMLEHLERSNLFLIALDDQRRWYRYHTLFADFLRSEVPEPERRALHAKASAWYEANGFVADAIKHALAAQDMAAAARLIRDSFEAMATVGEFTTLLGWLNALPEQFVRADSVLSCHKGWVLYLRGQIDAAEGYALAATTQQRPDASALQRGMLLAFQAFLAINRGEPGRAMQLAQAALSLLGDSESFFRTTALSHLGQALRLTGDLQLAIQTLRQAVQLGQQLGHHLIILEALGYLAPLLYMQGQLREALALCQQAADEYRDARGNPLPMAGLVHVPLGILYYETDDLDRAQYHLETGISLCQQLGTVYSTLVGLRTLARLHYGRGDRDLAWATLETARQLAVQSKNRQRIRLVSAVTAEFQLRDGQIAAAAHTLVDLHDAAGTRSQHETLTYAHVLLAQGHPDAAQRVLGQFEEAARRQGRNGSLIAIYLVQALAEQALAHPAAARERLEQALVLAAPDGYRRVFLDEGPAIAALLPQARHVAPSFVTSLLDAFPRTESRGLSAESLAPAHAVLSPQSSALPEPLSEAELKVLRLVATGLSNREIADRLVITVGTTKWHLNQIYGKLHVRNRTEAVALARQLQLL
jgi:LuxR family transcriptional regulator, maltose regulon positive regulatory protein